MLLDEKVIKVKNWVEAKIIIDFYKQPENGDFIFEGESSLHKINFKKFPYIYGYGTDGELWICGNEPGDWEDKTTIDFKQWIKEESLNSKKVKDKQSILKSIQDLKKISDNMNLK